MQAIIERLAKCRAGRGGFRGSCVQQQNSPLPAWKSSMRPGQAEQSSSKLSYRTAPRMSEEELQRRIRDNKLYADATARQAHKQQMQQQRLAEIDQKRLAVRIPDEKISAALQRMYKDAVKMMSARALRMTGITEMQEQPRVFRTTPRLAEPRSAPATSPASSLLAPSLMVSNSTLDEIIMRQYEGALRQREAKRQDLVQRLENDKTFTGPLPIFALASREEAEETVERLRNDAKDRRERADIIAREQQAKQQDLAAEEKEYHQGRWPHALPRKLARRPAPSL